VIWRVKGAIFEEIEQGTKQTWLIGGGKVFSLL
jgi:hypothetical protein